MDTVLANILRNWEKSTMNTVRSDLFRFFDEKVCELGKELFCSTSWVANLAWAMISFDYDLVEHDANFLDGCRNIVRKYGMSVWLYEMINDASIAVALQRPSSRMPFQIGLTYTKDVFRRSKQKGWKIRYQQKEETGLHG